MRLRETARAKLNLALHILGRRDDGYHELDSIVAFTDYGDVLEVEPSAEDALTIVGPFASALTDKNDNLVLKAVRAARDTYAEHGIDLPYLAITLEKNLPVASGIGGGSADAAAMLRLAERITGQALSTTEWMKKLGADVPVCFHQRPCRMQGIGEIITPHDITSKPVVLVNPMKPCSTASVFAFLGLTHGQSHKSGLDPKIPDQWRNDLLQPALHVEPEIRHVLDQLQTGHMSGSGATCFVLLENDADAAALAQRLKQSNPNWWVVATKLANRFP